MEERGTKSTRTVHVPQVVCAFACTCVVYVFNGKMIQLLFFLCYWCMCTVRIVELVHVSSTILFTVFIDSP